MNATSLRKTDACLFAELKEKMRVFGAGRLTDAELLSFILKSGDETKTAKELAEYILRRSGSLADVAQNDFCSLAKRNRGLGERKAALVMAAIELGKRAKLPRTCGIHINNAVAVYEALCGEYSDYDRECFKTILLTTKYDVISIEDISVGTLSTASIHVREVFKKAIIKSAYAIIVVHNHPSGNPTPSPSDDEVTDAIRSAGEVLGIKMLDHVIIGSKTFYSYAETRHSMEELIKNLK